MSRKFDISMDLTKNYDLITEDILDFYYYVSVLIPGILDSFENKKIIEEACNDDSLGCESILISIKFLKSGKFNGASEVDLISQILADYTFLSNKVKDYKSEEFYNEEHFNKWKESILKIID